jgi:meso-butanediol dehydrogenase / (S,S)-butanediol dehydrogenase / diacetyl reductase
MNSSQQDTRPVLLVTGGGTGIGAAAAYRLAPTHRVAICGRRVEPLERVARDTGALVIVGDVSVEAATAQIVGRVIERVLWPTRLPRAKRRHRAICSGCSDLG